jgi:HEAT repeat protein
MSRKPTSFDDKRVRIAALASEPEATAIAELRRYLGDRLGYLAGEAAEVAQRRELSALVPDLAGALARLLKEGAAADKGCHGKRRILEALLHFDADARDAYLAGLRYVQEEPAFGGKIDTAAPIRGLCAHALVNVDHPAALQEIAPLLVDPEPLVRSEAASALGRSGLEPAGAILHLKALTGDREPDVMQACYAALLRVDARRYVPVVAAALQSEEGAMEAAALALGEARVPEALPLLRQAAASAGAREERSVLMAIALVRSEEAIAFLLGLVEKAPEHTAENALAALALHRHDETIAARARALATARGTRKIAEALRDHFGA